MSSYTYGMHEKCPAGVLPEGWVLYLAELGSGPEEHPGIDLAGETRSVIIRAQHSWGAGGRCLPLPAELAGFVWRFVSMVRNTPACHIWIPGNEPNVAVEGLFQPGYVAEVYNLVRAEVHAIPGHENDQVLLPPIGPWNVDTGIGWVEYFQALIAGCEIVDGFALHTYARGSDPAAVLDQAKMDPPWQMYHSGFLTYQDWMAAIPTRYRDRPVYFTEFDENDTWENANTGIVQAAYAEIDRWNQVAGNQQIRALILYRWPAFDKYNIEGKQGVIDDFLAAQAHGYTWKENVPVAEWNVAYETSMTGFYDFVENGVPQAEVTVPGGSVPLYEHHEGNAAWLARPEWDKKDTNAGQPEVRTPPLAAGFFTMYSTLEAALVWRVPVTPGSKVRASIWSMTKTGGGRPGTRLGIALTDPGSGAIAVNAMATGGKFTGALEAKAQWGAWQEHANDVWGQLHSPEVTATGPYVWVLANGRNDDPKPGHTHWDDLLVESDNAVVPPDQPPSDDAEALLAYAATLRAIADGLAEMAPRIGVGGLSAFDRGLLQEAMDNISAVLV
jgi:hypothetical protein